MPELPEVETVVRLIRPRLEGRCIEKVRVHWTRTLGGLSPGRFRAAVSGKRIQRVWRRGKFIVLDLVRNGRAAGFLVGHLRMTGRMHVEPREVALGPYVRVALQLDDARWFVFVDVRKFGRLCFTEALEPLLGVLGPEPLGPDFTVSWLRQALGRRRRRLKPLLLDQTFVAGLGNIYVDEALHLSRLHPLRQSHAVGSEAVRRLHAAVRGTLQAAIALEGSSFDTFYRTPEGQPGRYQEQFQVYGRAGRTCRRCGTTIKRIIVAQRGTHVCPRCQRAPR